jgi:hypothetical protein
MTYRGRVQSGVVVLDDPSALVDGTVVEVEAVSSDAQTPNLDALKDVIGKAEGLPADASRNKHHYLYGQPKRD